MMTYPLNNFTSTSSKPPGLYLAWVSSPEEIILWTPEKMAEHLDWNIRDCIVNIPFIDWVKLASNILSPEVKDFLNQCRNIATQLKDYTESTDYVRQYTMVERVSDVIFFKGVADRINRNSESNVH